MEEVCQNLIRDSCTSHPLPARASERTRRREVLSDRAPVMVATNAFGMGIDKSNVPAFVLSTLGMPKNLEAYYQEDGPGKAGTGSRRSAFYFSAGRTWLPISFLLRGAGRRRAPTGHPADNGREQDKERLGR